MAYMLLIMEPHGQRDARGVDRGHEVYDRMLEYTASLRKRGVLIASDSLRADGARLNVRSGRRTVTDGPFAESKELVGGFFLVDCQTREQALALAAECPAAEWATIEVRETGPCYQ